jgi:uncharacterized protein YdhG (YjbR/CyaY superfamily)
MQSKATTVDAYLAEAPAARRASLDRLRTLCTRILTNATEDIEYGMPVYKIGGSPRVAFASQKQYVSLYIGPAIVERHRAELAGVDLGKSCIRYRKPDAIDFALVETMLTEARDDDRLAAC